MNRRGIIMKANNRINQGHDKKREKSFFFSLITGSLTSAYFAGANSYSVGASGAIFGLFGAMAIVGKRIGADVRSICVIIGINFAIGFIFGGIDWKAHLGGLIGGVVSAQIVLNSAKSYPQEFCTVWRELHGCN